MKTIEEKLHQYLNLPIDKEYRKGFSIGFKKGAQFVQRWIRIDEEKPTKQGHYLVKCKNSFPKNCDVVVAEFYEDNETFYSESTDCPINDVTHWRLIEFK